MLGAIQWKPLAIGGAAILAVLLAGLTWWFGLGSGDGDRATAQAVVQNACDLAESALHYDVSTTISAPFSSGPNATNKQAQMDARFSGEDVHLIVTHPDEVLEVIKVGGNLYMRAGASRGQGTWEQETDPDKIESFADYATAIFSPPSLEGNSLCPTVGNVEEVGEESLPAIPTGRGNEATSPTSATRYRIRRSDVIWKAPTATPDLNPSRSVGDSGSSGAQDITSTTTWDLWVDSNGQLVRTKIAIKATTADDGPPLKSTFDSRISGYGEANTITAPVLGGQ